MDPGVFLRFGDEVDFSTPASREPVPFEIEVYVKSPAVPVGEAAAGKKTQTKSSKKNKKPAPTTSYEITPVRTRAWFPRAVIEQVRVPGREGLGIKIIEEARTTKLEPELQGHYGAWKCSACLGRPDRVLHSFRAYFKNDPPLLLDRAARPVCGKQKCMRKLQALADRELVVLQREDEDCMPALNYTFCRNCLKMPTEKNDDEETVPAPMRVCARCNLASYCSKECQRLHWRAGHKDQCIDTRK